MIQPIFVCRPEMAACSHQPSSPSTAPTCATRLWCPSHTTTSATAWGSASTLLLQPHLLLVSAALLIHYLSELRCLLEQRVACLSYRCDKL